MKWFGAALVVLTCGWFGFSFASAHRAEEQSLRSLISILDFMECELQYRLTSLPELCRQAAREGKCRVHTVFSVLASELEEQVAPDAMSCMNAAVSRISGLPALTRTALLDLGQSLGRFDLSGQLSGLEAVRKHCREELDRLTVNRDARLRCYQTLGICAGAALVILFI